MPKPEKHLFVCVQNRPEAHPKGSCTARGGVPLVDEFRRLFEEKGLWGRFQVTTSGCLGPCEEGPSVLVYPEGIMYAKVTVEDVTEIVEQHLLEDSPVERLKISEEVWS